MAASDGSALKTIALVAAIAAGAAALVTASWEFSRERIETNRRARLLESLYSVLDPELIGQNLNPVLISVSGPDLLGSEAAIDVFVPMRAGEPVAAVFASVAPDGYNAPIELLVGIDAGSGEVMGVRAVSHRETPGLGDLIDVRKSAWILQFAGTSLEAPATTDWAVDKDDGEFDSITGATVTARAVVEAVRDTLLYFEAHRDDIFMAARNAVETDGSGRQE